MDVEGGSVLNRTIIALISLVAALTLSAEGVARAGTASLPSRTPLSTGMVDHPGASGLPNTIAVRTITQVGNIIWVGGIFDEIDDPSGNKVAKASGLAPFDATTGLLASGIHIPLFSSST